MPMTNEQRRRLAAMIRNVVQKAIRHEKVVARGALMRDAPDAFAPLIARNARAQQHADHQLDQAIYECVGELEELLDARDGEHSSTDTTSTETTGGRASTGGDWAPAPLSPPTGTSAGAGGRGRLGIPVLFAGGRVTR